MHNDAQREKDHPMKEVSLALNLTPKPYNPNPTTTISRPKRYTLNATP